MIDKIRNWNRERKRKAREKWRIRLELKELDEESLIQIMGDEYVTETERQP